MYEALQVLPTGSVPFAALCVGELLLALLFSILPREETVAFVLAEKTIYLLPF